MCDENTQANYPTRVESTYQAPTLARCRGEPYGKKINPHQLRDP